jgi:glycosyltransferase involved in cell wall biosynthesis
MGETEKSVSSKVCFIGGARYSDPLDPTNAKKFRALEQLGEIFVIGFSQDLKPRRFSEHGHFYLLPKFPLPVLRYLVMFTTSPVLAHWLIWRHGVHILVAQSPYEGFAAAIAKVVAGFFGQRIVLIVENHGDFEVSLFLQRRVHLPGLHGLLMRITARLALHHTDLLRAISNSTQEQLQRWAPYKPIVQFPTWTNIDAFLEVGDNGARRHPEIVYAGVLTPLKGVHHLINAFAQLAPEFPSARLLIIGREENAGYANKLRHQVARLSLDRRVAFLGEIPQAELARWIARVAVFVLPSLSEGLGRVVVEAMATGTAVIGSRVGGIPEMLQDGKTGFLVPPGDETALVERLRWVLLHFDEAQAMGTRAKEFARSFFSTDAYVNGYRQLFTIAQNVLQGG